MQNKQRMSCSGGHTSGVDAELVKQLGLSIPEAYQSAELMVRLAKAVRERDGMPFCQLPFCHTAEAEAMGGLIHDGDEISGPRARESLCSTLEEMLELPPMDLTTGRIHEILLACGMLREQGETVVLNVSGPLTILDTLLGAEMAFRAMRKKPEQMKAVFWKLGEELLRFMEEAASYGVSMLSYADPLAAPDILGPKLSRQVAEWFTGAFLKRAEQRLEKRALLLLCPRTAAPLLEAGLAEWEEVCLPVPVSYGEACAQMVGRAGITGQMCVHQAKAALRDGRFQMLKLR